MDELEALRLEIHALRNVIQRGFHHRDVVEAWNHYFPDKRRMFSGPEAQPDGHAVVMPDGWFVGIWRVKETADRVANGPNAKGYRVRAMRFVDPPAPDTIARPEWKEGNVAMAPDSEGGEAD